MIKSKLGGKGLFNLHFHIVVYHRRKSGQNLQLGRHLGAGEGAEAMEASCLLASSLWLPQPAFTSPGSEPTTLNLARPHQSLIKKTILQAYLQPDLIEAFS